MNSPASGVLQALAVDVVELQDHIIMYLEEQACKPGFGATFEEHVV